jgi:hypothetical protein
VQVARHCEIFSALHGFRDYGLAGHCVAGGWEPFAELLRPGMAGSNTAPNTSR